MHAFMSAARAITCLSSRSHAYARLAVPVPRMTAP
jgi:hypothetical protein